MSSSEVDDIRYQEYEIPSSLGENPSKDALKAFFSSYGNAWVCKIMNQSSNKITFANPYNNDARGEIAAGKQESNNTKGYVPLSTTGKHYVVRYYNTTASRWCDVSITDLNREWMLLFKQDGVADEREVQPVSGSTANITLIFDDNGYKFEGCGYGNIVLSRLKMILKHYPR